MLRKILAFVLCFKLVHPGGCIVLQVDRLRFWIRLWSRRLLGLRIISGGFSVGLDVQGLHHAGGTLLAQGSVAGVDGANQGFGFESDFYR